MYSLVTHPPIHRRYLLEFYTEEAGVVHAPVVTTKEQASPEVASLCPHTDCPCLPFARVSFLECPSLNNAGIMTERNFLGTFATLNYPRPPPPFASQKKCCPARYPKYDRKGGKNIYILCSCRGLKYLPSSQKKFPALVYCFFSPPLCLPGVTQFFFPALK